jgi:hypothetical protein
MRLWLLEMDIVNFDVAMFMVMFGDGWPDDPLYSKAMAICWLLKIEGEESDEIVKFVLDRHGHPWEAAEEE